MTPKEKQNFIKSYKDGKKTEVIKDKVKVRYIEIDKKWLNRIIKAKKDELRV